MRKNNENNAIEMRPASSNNKKHINKANKT